MSSPIPTTPSTASSSGPTQPLTRPEPTIAGLIRDADAVLVGAGSGLSTAAGLTYSGERFQRLFADLIERHGLSDMYSAGFHRFPTPEEKWAYWSRHVVANRYDQPERPVYQRLRGLLEGVDHFVLTTNVDHAFELNGFAPQRLFATQGDYGLFQCSVPCRQQTWSNESAVRAMAEHQHDGRIPTELLPACPNCGAPAAMNLRADATFVQDDAWYEAAERYQAWLDDHTTGRVLYLEFGVGWNTPSIIKYPFWHRVHANPDAHYALVNQEAAVPDEIAERTTFFEGDIAGHLA